ncbi:MAG: hypothetical protein PHY08_02815 [Candidatus Cloacimonetes bacterium]|jgi:hypothetical protein|nr:hypothetical protein [Candidatus Cloacimonadota bacterium]MDD4155483.1 hypothetical protein [Candidatus Cloacimonadota bacterium]
MGNNLKHNRSDFSLGIILIGLGLIFLIKPFSLFPWILLVISLIYLKNFFFSSNKRSNLSGFIWLAGLFLIFYFNIFWPAILILIGIQILINSLYKNNNF